MKRLLSLFAIILITNFAFAQPISMRPNWTYNTPEAEDNTYEYYVSKGIGKTEKEARTDAYILAVKEAQSRLGVGANSTEIFKAFQDSDKEDFNVVASHYEIPMKEVCNFSEKNGDQWYYYQLLQVAVRGNITPKYKPYAGDCYDFSKAKELIKKGKIGVKKQSRNDNRTGEESPISSGDNRIEEENLQPPIDKSSPRQIQINFQDYQVLPADLNGTYTWEEAKSVCANLTAFGESDWYLPNKNEIAGLYDHEKEIGGFSHGVNDRYWSSSEYSYSSGSAWVQEFSPNRRQTYISKEHYLLVRCVRKYK